MVSMANPMDRGEHSDQFTMYFFFRDLTIH